MWRTRLKDSLARLDPLDVLLLGGLGAVGVGAFLIAGVGWALLVVGACALALWTITTCR
jgi:hypothetical protein